MDLPIDTTTLSFICAGEPTPVVDYTTGRPKTDQSGTPLFQVSVVAMSPGGEAEVLKVKVPGQPHGITSGGPVRLVEFTASPWAMRDASGVAYRARAVQPATPTPPAAPVSGPAGSGSGGVKGGSGS